jgi:hypothetical protein
MYVKITPRIQLSTSVICIWMMSCRLGLTVQGSSVVVCGAHPGLASRHGSNPIVQTTSMIQQLACPSPYSTCIYHEFLSTSSVSVTGQPLYIRPTKASPRGEPRKLSREHPDKADLCPHVPRLHLDEYFNSEPTLSTKPHLDRNFFQQKADRV